MTASLADAVPVVGVPAMILCSTRKMRKKMTVEEAFYELEELFSQINYLRTEIDSQEVYQVVHCPRAGEELALATAKVKQILSSISGE